MARSAKIRLDQLLLRRGLAASPKEAQALIMGGKVSSGHRRLEKPGELLNPDTDLHVKDRKEHPWVSRGGVKLDHAISHFGLTVKGRVALDIGSSTGGFTDVLLHHGAARVYAVDVGYSELAWKLQQDSRVIMLERTNARDVTRERVPEAVQIITCDVSFTTLHNVLPGPMALAAEKADLIALIKPQFEVKKHEVGEGGIVRDPSLHERVCFEVSEWLNSRPGWRVRGLTESPITGTEGNKEFLLWAECGHE